jgi:hypothetical protein
MHDAKVIEEPEALRLPGEPDGDSKATSKSNFAIRPNRRNQAESNGR